MENLSQVTVVVIPVVALTSLILYLNVVAPSSADVRVIKKVVQILPQVRGRVIEVPAEGNRPMKKGDVLFKVDPTPYQLTVNQLEAQLATAIAGEKELQETLKAATGKVAESQAAAGERQVKEKLAGRVGDDLAQVALIRAQLESAKWELSQTVTYAPADGTVINLQLRPGAFVVPMPLQPVMSFVEDDYDAIALYMQDELGKVEPGDEAEISLPTYPGRVLKATVDSIIWAQGQGQLALLGNIPQTGGAPLPPGRFPVKLKLADKDRGLFLAAGAVGHGAIYTHDGAWAHIIRKVILRVDSYLNYLILKLH